jgi:hypothetical protein
MCRVYKRKHLGFPLSVTNTQQQLQQRYRLAYLLRLFRWKAKFVLVTSKVRPNNVQLVS